MHGHLLGGLVLGVVALLAYATQAHAQPVAWDSVHYHRNLFFRAIDCADRSNCGAVGTQGARQTILFVTTDHGSSWQTRIIEDYAVTGYLPAEPFDIASPSAGTYLVAADSGIIWKTTDGGASFRKLRIPIDGIVSFVEMWDDQRGVAARNSDEIYLTHDGWQTWRHVALPDSMGRLVLVEVHAMGIDTLVVSMINSAKTKQTLFLSSDDGATWTSRPGPPDPNRTSIPDHRLIVSAGDRRVDTPVTVASRTVAWISTDFAMTWQPTLDTVFWSGWGVSGISMADTRFGLAYGNNGQVWSTTDGGRSWVTDTLPLRPQSSRFFRDVFAFADGSAIAVMGTELIMARPPMLSGIDDGDIEATPGDIELRVDRASGLAMLTITGRSSQAIEPTLYDVIGRTVEVPTRASAGCGDDRQCWVIDVAGLGRGVYFVSLRGSPRSLPLVISR